MSDVLELLQSSIDSSMVNNEYFKKYLKSCIEQGAFFSKKNTGTVIKTINTSINSSFERERGLTLLLAYLPQTSVEEFSNNAVSWMIHCVKVIHHKGETIDILGLKIFTRLITFSRKFPEVNKETAKQIIPKFMTDHVRHINNAQISSELLECLQACMTEYPGPSGEFRGDILKLLASTVEMTREVVDVAACCVPLVARIGGGGKQGVSHRTGWHKLQLSMITLMHSLLNEMFEHVDCLMDIEVIPPSSDDLQLIVEPITEKNILFKTQRIATQFTSIALFLQTMLLREFPVAKSVAQDAILDVISRTQKLTHVTLGTSREALAVSSVLPTVEVAALRLLESLILCVGCNLVPRGGLVCHLCSQVIVWTNQQHSNWPYAMDKPYSETRLAAYCCLFSWLSVAGPVSQVDTILDKSLPILLADIHMHKPTVRLRVGSKPGRGKKKQQMLVSQEDRSEKLSDIFANRELCERALLTITVAIRASSAHFKPEIYLSIWSTVLKLATELPVPYSAATCQVALYHLLLTLCLEHHPRVAPQLAPALAIFTAGLHHSNLQLKIMCVSALSSLEKIIHPTAATLYYPLPQEKEKLLVNDAEEDSDVSDNLAKRRKTDSLENSTYLIKDDSEENSNLVSITLDDSDEQSSVVLLSESTVGKVAMEDYNNSNEIEESFISKNEYEEPREIINQSGNDITVIAKNKSDNNASELNKTEDVILLEENEKRKCMMHTRSSKRQENVAINKTTVIIPTQVLSASVDSDIVLLEPADPDVSQMLMDFKDEV